MMCNVHWKVHVIFSGVCRIVAGGLMITVEAQSIDLKLFQTQIKSNQHRSFIVDFDAIS